jgi:hypothetical protein
MAGLVMLLGLGLAAPHLYDLTTEVDDVERVATAAAKDDGGHLQAQDRWTADCRRQGGVGRYVCVVVERQVDRYYLDVRQDFCAERRVEVQDLRAVSVVRGDRYGCGYPPNAAHLRPVP